MRFIENQCLRMVVFLGARDNIDIISHKSPAEQVWGAVLHCHSFSVLHALRG